MATIASGSPGQRQKQRAAQETNRREQSDSGNSTPPQVAQGRKQIRYLLDQSIHTGKGNGEDEGKSDCAPDSIFAMFYQLFLRIVRYFVSLLAL